MLEVVILGTGNVASHLYKAFSEKENIDVIQVYNHNNESLKSFSTYTDTTTNIQELKAADFYLIAIKDDVITEIAQQLSKYKGIILHTSGAVGIDRLKYTANYGIFYPLQSFSRNTPRLFIELMLSNAKSSMNN